MTYCPSGSAPLDGAARQARDLRSEPAASSFARLQFQLETSTSKFLTNSQTPGGFTGSQSSFVMCNRSSAAHTFAAKDEEDFENHV